MKEILSISLHGPMRIYAPDGRRIELSSRKGMALLAMLALVPQQEHDRDWFRRMLWGRSQPEQGQASLRKELSRLRKELEAHGVFGLLCSEGRRLWLAPDHYHLLPGLPGQLLLEGLDVPGAADFNAWAAEQRRAAAASPLPARPISAVAATVAEAEPPRLAQGLAVLPFVNESGDAANDYVAAGIGDELADRIARLRWLKVIGSGASFAVGGGEDLLAAGRRLGAAYVFGGRLRKAASGWQLSGRLMACADGEIICAPALELPNPQESNAFVPIIDQMVALLAERLDDNERERVAALPADRLDVNDLIWRGRWHQNRLSRPELETAAGFFAEALRRAPQSANAAIEWTQNLGYRLWSRRATAEDIAAFGAAARRAVDLDRRDGRAHMLVGVAEMWLRRMDTAEMWLREAISLCPSLAMAHEQLATLFNLTGQPNAAAEALHTALRLSPHDFRRFYREAELALAYLMQGEWQAAIARANIAIALQPGYWHPHVSRVGAYWRMNDLAAARGAHDQLLLARPRFRIDQIDWIPFRYDALNAWLKEPLQQLQAG